jgi:hypothetical protein
MEEVAYSNNITKVGEGIMEDVVQLRTMLTTRVAGILSTCSKERIEEEQEQGHHQEEGRDHILKEEGVPGEKAVISACSNGSLDPYPRHHQVGPVQGH